jgi:hypothetical protein
MLKTVSSIINAIGALNYKGTWDAATNTPTITSSVGTKGDYYQVSVAGSTTINGISNWGVGDVIAFNGATWQRIEGGPDLNGVNLSVSGTTTLSGLTASTALALDANKNVVSVTNTGTGDNVLATSPTLTTPTLGAATATSINKVALTAPATGSTLTIANSKTFTVNNTLTLAGTDATTMTFPATSATIARTDAGQTFSGVQNFYGASSNFGDTANTAQSFSWVRNNVSVGAIGTANNQLTISGRLNFPPGDATLTQIGDQSSPPADGHRLRLSNWKTSIGSGEALGTLEWYSNDLSGGGAGVRAIIQAIENDSGTGRSYDLGFGTGAAATATIKCRVNKNGHFVPEADDTYSIGIDGQRWSAIWAANGTIQTSDERKKTDVADSNLGLSFIAALRPVSYKWISGGKVATTEPDGFMEVVTEPEVTDEEGNVIREAKTEMVQKFKEVLVERPGKRTHYGLLAQQVKEVLGDQDFGGFVYSEESDTFGVRYDQFIAPMIKAIQELKSQVDALKSEVAYLKGI